ncbi:hypothetical protein F4811DRAFT_499486 [Daldinia bambusicola]|nr:hypothetical protein F4811DRAFT_499486 [Daldinia bambusicola]
MEYEPYAKPNIVSLDAFLGLYWTGFALCTVAFVGRAYIRISCHRKLLLDDWLMIISLLLLLSTAILGQITLHYVYTEKAVLGGLEAPGTDISSIIEKVQRFFGVFFILCYIGIFLIKLGFLVFFYRLGNNVLKFRILWWVFLVLTLACFAVIMGTGEFDCLFGSFEYIIQVCSEASNQLKSKAIFKASVALDVITDGMIIFFPAFVLWGTKISLRKKLLLSTIFCLVLLTIAVTVVRTSAYGGAGETVTDIIWVWFWIVTEWVVSFLVACLVSFRSLFVQRERLAGYAREREEQRARPAGFHARVKHFQVSVVETFKTLDDWDSHEMRSLPITESGTSNADLFGEGAWTGTTRSADDRADSVRTLHPTPHVSQI